MHVSWTYGGWANFTCVSLTVHGQLTPQLQHPCHRQVHDRKVFVDVQDLTCMHPVCREGMFRKQSVGIYVETVPCAHAVSLTVCYAKGNMANWYHLVGLLGTRGLSMVPRHIGVVKINTVTLFGRKKTLNYLLCVYFSLSLTLRVQAAFTPGESGNVENLAGHHKRNIIVCMHQQQNHNDKKLLHFIYPL